MSFLSRYQTDFVQPYGMPTRWLARRICAPVRSPISAGPAMRRNNVAILATASRASAPSPPLARRRRGRAVSVRVDENSFSTEVLSIMVTMVSTVESWRI